MSEPIFTTDDSRHRSFHEIDLNVPELYQRVPIEMKSGAPKRGILSRFYSARFLPFKLRAYGMRFLRQINADLSWFNEFHSYWTTALNGRYLGLYDFFFLNTYYRMQFGRSQVPTTTDASVHVQAWQQPNVLYQLFFTVNKERDAGQTTLLNNLRFLHQKLHAILEFGSAIGSTTRFYLDFFKPEPNFRAYISDIQTFAFHYGAWRFRNRPNVIPILLRPEDDLQINLPGKVDAIFCTTVYEHLNKPLETTRRFYEGLNPGGILIFDYIKSHASGLDTQQGLDERADVLHFIEEHFEVVAGNLNYEASMPTTVVRKR